MIKVFICPKCGWMRAVSRRKQVECFKCNNQEMAATKLTFLDFTEMSEQQREDYVESWQYLHCRNT